MKENSPKSICCARRVYKLSMTTVGVESNSENYIRIRCEKCARDFRTEEVICARCKAINLLLHFGYSSSVDVIPCMQPIQLAHLRKIDKNVSTYTRFRFSLTVNELSKRTILNNVNPFNHPFAKPKKTLEDWRRWIAAAFKRIHTLGTMRVRDFQRFSKHQKLIGSHLLCTSLNTIAFFGHLRSSRRNLFAMRFKMSFTFAAVFFSWHAIFGNILLWLVRHCLEWLTGQFL